MDNAFPVQINDKGNNFFEDIVDTDLVGQFATPDTFF
jgi:hypothetical protein